MTRASFLSLGSVPGQTPTTFGAVRSPETKWASISTSRPRSRVKDFPSRSVLLTRSRQLRPAV